MIVLALERRCPSRIQAMTSPGLVIAGNDNPRPFTWTKTAGEILNSLAGYLTKAGASQRSTQQN